MKKDYSRIPPEVKKLVNDIHARTLKILTSHKEGFLQVAELLLEKEVIFAEDVEKILGPKVLPPEDERKPEKKEQTENTPDNGQQPEA